VADIDIVQPVAGATRVVFNYQAASDALDAISAMGTKLSDQTPGRAAAQADVVVNWAGVFRQQFDDAAHLLNLRFSAAIEVAGYASGSIYQAVTNANDEQRRRNEAAELARTQPQPTGPGGSRGPI
jgi:hypothetical protein